MPRPPRRPPRGRARPAATAVADARPAPAARGRRVRLDGGGLDGGGGGEGDERRELRRLLLALRTLRGGDFSVRLPDVFGDPLLEEIADTFNDIAHLNQRVSEEITRVSTTVGRQGQMTDRASIGPVGGGWSHKINAVNQLIGDLITPTTEVARVLSAVARGDLGQKMALEIDGKPVQGEFLRIATTVNTMLDQLSAFSSEVTRVAREVGTEGVLGGQAEVPNVAGTWKDLTDAVNFMAGNLTGQVRNIALVTTAVANGDLSPEDHGGRQGRDAGAEEHHQHDGGPALRLCVRGDARGPRGGHGGQAGRPGAGGGRGRRVARPDGQREPAGRQPDRPAARRERGGHGHRGRRPDAQDHRGGQRRDPADQGGDQRHGRPALRVRGRGDARGARGGHGGRAGRPGRGAQRRGDVEGPDGLRELHGVQPDRARCATSPT